MELKELYLERCLKETEEIIVQENQSFLNTSIQYFKQHQEEFLYIESPSFEEYRIDAISLELDDVFKTYTALLGLKVQKKYASSIKSFLQENLVGENNIYSASFSNEDGLWELNLSLNPMNGFSEEMSINDAIQLTLNFISALVQSIEQ